MNEPLNSAEVRRRQQARARVMGLALLGLAVLIFAITIVKIKLAT